MSFTADIKAFAKKTGQNAEEQAAATLFKLNSLVVNRTPVDTGRARGGWVASVGSPSQGKGRADKGGQGTIRSANNQADKAIKNKDIYYLANNVKHIVKLEYGSSDQAPNGMVRVSMQEIKGLIGGS